MSRVETAVILAAGRGLRLSGEIDDQPKGFIRFGEHTIVEESIGRLQQAGIRDIVIVTGHLAGHYEDLAAGRKNVLRTVHNPHYADSGSMYSLWCAREIARGPFLLLESDLVYESRALATLLDGPFEDAILLSGPTGAGDEIWVATQQGRLTDMSKHRDALAGPVTGELVGISRVSAPLFALMCGIAEAVFQKSRHFDYETGCLVEAGKRRAIACPVVADLVWGEIDDAGHLARVRERIWPELERRRASAVARSRQ